jgi:hypothetical protein
MLFINIIFIFVFAITSAWADKICVQELDGQKVYTNLCGKDSKKIIIKKESKKKLTPSFIDSSYSREELEKIVNEKSAQYGVDAKLIKEIIKEESNWNINAVSPKGAMGIMQLMPSTALLMGVTNPFDPIANIDGGIRYMKYLLERFSGNITLALASYNAGPNLVESLGRVPNISETQNYVKRITMRYSGMMPERTGSSVTSRKSSPIKAVILSDGTVLYTNRMDMYIWSTKQ